MSTLFNLLKKTLLMFKVNVNNSAKSMEMSCARCVKCDISLPAKLFSFRGK